jgi:hypothetical protein
MWKPSFYLEEKAHANLFLECGSQPYIWRRRRKPIFSLKVDSLLPEEASEATAEASL